MNDQTQIADSSSAAEKHGRDHSHHPHYKQLTNEDGSWKYTNALAGETSPYLLQHAHNPVDWFPWGQAAFDKARSEGKPIFLSIGYSTCYWCHVMERLSFENPDIAAIMNEHFVNIKVDREERPDVDDIYMAATMIMNRSGGWPMSVFLSPPGARGEDDSGLRPYFAGTYFPPTSQMGMPSFPQVLQHVSDQWKSSRDEFLGRADKVADYVSQYLNRKAQAGELSVDLIQNATNTLLRSYDDEHGGFGGAPKFPQPAVLDLLLAVQRNNTNQDLAKALTHTLDRMARGGMYDQVGGGFHRYSTDEKWLVPHFEKMLYDNGQLVETYVAARRIGLAEDHDRQFLRVIREVCDYVLREMVDETGAFWSAQDAEVDAREGGNYVWIEQQVREAIDDDQLADLAVKMYGLDKGTNFKDPHASDAEPVNVLYMPQRLKDLADAEGMSLDEIQGKRDAINRQLLEVRDRRKQPGTDDKVLVAWNGMMIAGLAAAGRILDEPRYIEAATRSVDAILKHMCDSEGKAAALFRSMRKGEAKIPAFLEDYAFLVHGLIELHLATSDKRFLDEAIRLNDVAIARFSAVQVFDGGYFDTLADQSDLFVRVRSVHDGALPSGNSRMVHNHISLYEITGEDRYIDRAVRDLQSFAGLMSEQGVGMANMLRALLRAMELAPQRVANAQPATSPSEQPVTVTADCDEVDLSHGEAKLTITIDIAEGHHINANQPGDDAVIPTTVELVAGDDLAIDVHYPEPVAKQYPFADRPIKVHEGKLTLPLTIRKTGDVAKGATPRLVVRYQACTEAACLQPQAVRLPITVK